jgi:hypothetical protein
VKRTKYKIEPPKSFLLKDLGTLREESKKLAPKIFTKSGEKRKRIKPEDEKRWSELAAISKEWDEYNAAISKKKREKKIQTYKEILAKAGFQEGDVVTLKGKYIYPVTGKIHFFRMDGSMMIGNVMLYPNDIPYLVHIQK